MRVGCPVKASCMSPPWAESQGRETETQRRFADKIFAAIHADPKTELEINLPAQTITLVPTGESEKFDISPYKKDNMINGFDDIDYLQSIKGEIEEFAAQLPL